MANDSKDSILKNTGLITLCTLGSRVTGLLRTWAMAFALGNTLLTSAYQIAYNMPSMIYELAASGLLATAFLPLYLLQKEKKGNGEAYWHFAGRAVPVRHPDSRIGEAGFPLPSSHQSA